MTGIRSKRGSVVGMEGFNMESTRAACPLTVDHLEAAAVAAHRAGDTWDTFWRQYGPHAITIEPHDRHRFQRLLRRLTALVAAGDLDGMDAASDPAPWEQDDSAGCAVVSDTETHARVDWEGMGIVPTGPMTVAPPL